MTPQKYSKKSFETHLNRITIIGFESDDWIIGGKRRKVYAYRNLYGTAIRRYDPIAFEVAYHEWERQNNR